MTNFFSPFRNKDQDSQDTAEDAEKPVVVAHPLDELTGGVFSAETSSQRANLVKQWLLTKPEVEHLQSVFKELSNKDHGVAKLVREKIDELKRLSHQAEIVDTWLNKGQLVLTAKPFSIASAMAWQRDAAKDGAPLSKEPLFKLRQQLNEQIKIIEGLQESILVHKEKSVLLAQRIEMYSTKAISISETDTPLLERDVNDWQQETQRLQQDGSIELIDMKYPAQLIASSQQLNIVWQAFKAELDLAVAAKKEFTSTLPKVQFWADEIKILRGEKHNVVAASIDDNAQLNVENKEKAKNLINSVVSELKKEISAGHNKNTVRLANSLRQHLKDFSAQLDKDLEIKANAVLIEAKELEDWQRWSADKVRKQLIEKAKALIEPITEQNLISKVEVELEHKVKEEVATQLLQTQEQQSDVNLVDSSQNLVESNCVVETLKDSQQENIKDKVKKVLPKSKFGGRKIQEILRQLREEWRQTDKGGIPNNELWKVFDSACNEAYLIVEDWLQKVKIESIKNFNNRTELIAEVENWTQQKQQQVEHDWKAIQKQLFHFADSWKQLGHVSEKQFAQLQQKWKEAVANAKKNLFAAQKASSTIRQNLIAEAKQLTDQATLPLDAIKELQQRWQQEAKRVPLDRKHEQKLWDEFRKPIDAVFARKDEHRSKLVVAANEFEKSVMDAVQDLEKSIANQNAASIQQSINNLQLIMRPPQEVVVDETKKDLDKQTETKAVEKSTVIDVSTTTIDQVSDNIQNEKINVMGDNITNEQNDEINDNEIKVPAAVVATPVKLVKPQPLLARRGDDRPNAKIAVAKPMVESKSFVQRDRTVKIVEPRAPKLSNQVFYATKNILEKAQHSLRKLSIQAHGEALLKLLNAWKTRDIKDFPLVSDFTKTVKAPIINSWCKAISSPAQEEIDKTLLIRIEIAAEVPTIVSDLQLRRELQLQLLTHRQQETPIQTWMQDLAKIFTTPYGEETAKRLQVALKVLLRNK